MGPLIILLVLAVATSDAQEFTYENTSSWKDTWKTCGGNLQTPIDIVTSDTVQICPKNPLKFNGFSNQPLSMRLFNDGHYANWEFTYESGKDPTISGGPLSGTYKFLQIHVHFGINNQVGSEHALNGRTFPAEIHFVLWNMKYANVMEASQKPDGMSLMAIFVETDDYETESWPFDKNIFANIVKFNTSYTYQPNEMFSISKLFATRRRPYGPHGHGHESYGHGSYGHGSRGHGRRHRLRHSHRPFYQNQPAYFHYRGSLTKPLCSEVVTWIIIGTPLKVKSDTLDLTLRLLENSKGEKIKINYRERQPLNNRKVEVSYDNVLC